MASSALGELVLYAFNLCQVRITSITQAHMETARMAANLRWSGRILWACTAGLHSGTELLRSRKCWP